MTGRPALRPEDIVAILDWASGKESKDNRELVSYARAHGFLSEESEDAKSLVVARDKVFLLRASAPTLRRQLGPNIVSPPGSGMLR